MVSVERVERLGANDRIGTFVSLGLVRDFTRIGTGRDSPYRGESLTDAITAGLPLSRCGVLLRPVAISTIVISQFVTVVSAIIPLRDIHTDEVLALNHES